MGNWNYAPQENAFERASQEELSDLYGATSLSLLRRGMFRTCSAKLIGSYDGFWPLYDGADVPVYIKKLPGSQAKNVASYLDVNAGIIFIFQPFSYFRPQEHENKVFYTTQRCAYVRQHGTEQQLEWTFLSRLHDEEQEVWASCRAIADQESNQIVRGTTDLRAAQSGGQGQLAMTSEECMDLQRLVALL